MGRNVLAISVSFASLAFPSAAFPQTLSMASHPFPAMSWQASYRYNCANRNVGFSLSVIDGRAELSGLDIGVASTAENITEVNAALAAIHFDRQRVTCSGNNATVIFVGWEKSEDGTLGKVRSVNVQSPSPTDESLSVRAD